MTLENNNSSNDAANSSCQHLLLGEVISNKMNKTIVVRLERKVKHPLYGKYVRKYTKMYAHDEDNVCQIGDKVLIKSSRPYSKTKSWVLVEVVNTVN